jgi:hypothetical protein
VKVLLLALVLTATPLVAQRGEPLTMTPEEVVRLRAYHFRIVQAADRLPSRASLADVLGSVMQLAAARSADRPAVEENRAAILAVAVYANGLDLTRLAPEAEDWPQPRRRSLRLRGRSDLTQHFTVSAALAAAAGAPIANAIGLYKELEDARRGSGFSFADLTADRAGSMFGETATASAAAAARMQSRLAEDFAEADMMPEIEHLPEGLTEREFTRRYRDDRAPAYRRLLEEIDRRIAALPLFRIE